jgi:putative ABC transport system substrate-binding protein
MTFVGGVALWPLAVRAQQPALVRRVGVLVPFAENEEGLIAALRRRLQELGWTEGRDLRIDIRLAGNDGGRMRIDAAELVALAPDAIVSTTSTAARALSDATLNIPIVMAIIGDPVALGFTKSMSHPTGNVTGFTTFNDTLATKRLEMLRELVPTTRKAALMWAPANPQQLLLEKLTQGAAQALGIELLSLPLSTADDIEPAFAKVDSERATALIVAADPLTIANGRAIIDGCLVRDLPAMHTYVSEARIGALMSYGADVIENYDRAADYVDRILKGTKVADLPFQEPTRFTLAINLRTARSIRITIPQPLLMRADEVFE